MATVSHPMPAERVAALQQLAQSSPYWDKKDDPALQLRHDMVRAKISAFMERQDTVYRRHPLSNDSLPARYAHAISTYLHGDLRSALTQIDGLIQAQPNNPYFYELRGQARLILEHGDELLVLAEVREEGLDHEELGEPVQAALPDTARSPTGRSRST